MRCVLEQNALFHMGPVEGYKMTDPLTNELPVQGKCDLGLLHVTTAARVSGFNRPRAQDSALRFLKRVLP